MREFSFVQSVRKVTEIQEKVLPCETNFKVINNQPKIAF